MQEQPQARDLWFLDTWVTLRRLSSEGPDGVSTPSEAGTRYLYKKIYCARGDMEICQA